MKTLLSALLSVAFGFGLSRMIPGPPSGREPSANSIPASVPANNPSGNSGRASATKETEKTTSAESDWRAAAKAWAAEDPSGFCEWLVKRGIPPDEALLFQMFAGWVKQDLEAAFTAARNLPGDFYDREGVPGLLDVMMNQALEMPGGLSGVWKWIPLMEDQKNGYIVPDLKCLTFSPPEGVAAFLKDKASGKGYMGLLVSQFGGFWAEKDLPAAMAWMNGLSGPLKTLATTGIMQAWSKQDPAAALKYLATEASTEARGDSHMALAALAEKDPKAALDWWEKNLGVTNWQTLPGIFKVWCKADSAQALDYSMEISDPGLRRQCLAAWGERAQSGEVLKACEEMPEGRDRQALVEAFAANENNWGKSTDDIRRLEKEPSDRITPEMANTVSRSYAYQDPAAAFAWAGTLPENLQAASLTWILDIWKDNAAAAQVFKKLPEGSFKNTAGKLINDRIKGQVKEP